MKHVELKTRPRSFQHICVKLISRTEGSILVQVTEAAGDWRWVWIQLTDHLNVL